MARNPHAEADPLQVFVGQRREVRAGRNDYKSDESGPSGHQIPRDPELHAAVLENARKLSIPSGMPRAFRSAICQ